MGSAHLRIEWSGLYWLLARHAVKIIADIDQVLFYMLCIEVNKHKSKNHDLDRLAEQAWPKKGLLYGTQ